MSSQLNASAAKNRAKKEIGDSSDSDDGPANGRPDKHHPALLAILAEELSVRPEEIHDFEL